VLGPDRHSVAVQGKAAASLGPVKPLCPAAPDADCGSLSFNLPRLRRCRHAAPEVRQG
jgi:hypothetical protein